jgi:hypothetical protein
MSVAQSLKHSRISCYFLKIFTLKTNLTRHIKNNKCEKKEPEFIIEESSDEEDNIDDIKKLKKEMKKMKLRKCV